MGTKFSIVIPVYNVAPYLKECLDSVLAQKVGAWEAICVDDGSTDGSADILDAYARRDSRFVVIHQQNAGVSAARNAALDVACGDWLCFLDADDVWSPEILISCEQALAHHPEVDLIQFSYRHFAQVADLNWKPYQEDRVTVCDISERVPQVPVTECLWGKISRRTVVADLRFTKCAYGEDIIFSFEVLNRCSSLLTIEQAYYGYRMRAGSAMSLPVSDKWLHGLMYTSSSVLRMIACSNKVFPPSAVRFECNKLIEEFYSKLFEGKKAGLDFSSWRVMWHRSLREVLVNPKIRGFQRIRIFALVMCPLVPVEWLLCYLPNWLKRKGFHR